MTPDVDSIIDATALSAWIKDGAGSSAIEPFIDSAALSAITLATIAAEFGASLEEDAVSHALHFGLPVLPLDAELAVDVARIRRVTGSHKLTLENLAVLASARVHGLRVITADDALDGVRIAGVEIQHVPT